MPRRATSPRAKTAKRTAAKTKTSPAAGADETEAIGGPDTRKANRQSKSSQSESAETAKARTKTMFGNATAFVQQAAAVLQEELHAGIDAAKSIEQRFIDVKSLRAGGTEEVIKRVRGDIHTLIDMVMDLLALGGHSLEGLAQRVVKVSMPVSSGSSTPPAPGGSVPILSPLLPAKRGETIELDMALENAADTAVEVPSFDVSDLMSSGGARISAHGVSFSPSRVNIPPRGKAHVKIGIRIPKVLPSGTFSGLMTARKLDDVQAQAVLQLQVV